MSAAPPRPEPYVPAESGLRDFMTWAAENYSDGVLGDPERGEGMAIPDDVRGAFERALDEAAAMEGWDMNHGWQGADPSGSQV